MKFLAIILVCVSVVIADQFIPIDEAVLARYKSLGHLQLSKGVQAPNSQVTTSNPINDRLVALLENARDQFHEGFPESGIPPLDPFKYDDSLSFKVQEGGLFKADITLSNLHIAGLQGFEIENLALRIVGLNLDFHFTIPRIEYNSHYKINGRVLTIFPWKPSGNANIVAKDIEVYGKAVLATSNGYLVLRGFQVEFDVRKTDLEIEGLLGNGVVNSFLNWLLNLLSDNFIQNQRIRLSEYLSEVLFDIISEVIGKYSLADLLG